MTTYIDILPKELKNLLDFYKNYSLRCVIDYFLYNYVPSIYMTNNCQTEIENRKSLYIPTNLDVRTICNGDWIRFVLIPEHNLDVSILKELVIKYAERHSTANISYIWGTVQQINRKLKDHGLNYVIILQLDPFVDTCHVLIKESN